MMTLIVMMMITVFILFKWLFLQSDGSWCLGRSVWHGEMLTKLSIGDGTLWIWEVWRRSHPQSSMSLSWSKSDCEHAAQSPWTPPIPPDLTSSKVKGQGFPLYLFAALKRCLRGTPRGLFLDPEKRGARMKLESEFISESGNVIKMLFQYHYSGEIKRKGHQLLIFCETL